MHKSIFKIFRLSEWTAFHEAGTFHGSPDDLRDGFIHLSAADQVEGVLDRYFGGETSIVVAEFKLGTATETLRWEASTSGDEYPHVYGKLTTSMIAQSQQLERKADRFVVPDWVGGSDA